MFREPLRDHGIELRRLTRYGWSRGPSSDDHPEDVPENHDFVLHWSDFEWADVASPA